MSPNRFHMFSTPSQLLDWKPSAVCQFCTSVPQGKWRQGPVNTQYLFILQYTAMTGTVLELDDRISTNKYLNIFTRIWENFNKWDFCVGPPLVLDWTLDNKGSIYIVGISSWKKYYVLTSLRKEILLLIFSGYNFSCFDFI